MADVHAGRPRCHHAGMARPTFIQRYYLFQIAWMRWFGLVFAIGSMAITASNLPGLLEAGDNSLLAVNLGVAGAFAFVGIGLYRIGTVVQRRYRAHIQRQID